MFELRRSAGHNHAAMRNLARALAAFFMNTGVIHLSECLAVAHPGASQPAPGAAVPGVVVVELAPELASNIADTDAALGRTGDASMDSRLANVSAYRLDRVFGSALEPAKRAAGLDRFFLVRFDAAISPADAASRIAGPGVVRAEPDYLLRASDVTPDDNYFPQQWGLKNHSLSGGIPDCDVDADCAWIHGTGSSSLTVAIIDTGVDGTHPEFAGRMVAGFDYINGDSDASDDNGHGTSCAGVAAAMGNNSIGVAGVAWNVMIMPLKVLAANGEGSTTAVANGITWAADHGAKILSLSLGGPGSGSLQTAVNYAYTTKGCLLFCASGNDNLPSISWPAAYGNAVAVGACSLCNERKNPASCDGENWWGSNYSADLDFVAPGVKIPTTDIVGPSGESSADYWVAFNGTSSATPHAAGVAALVWSAQPSLTNAQVWDLMKKSCEDIGAYGFDNETGWGRVNAANAIALSYLADATSGPLGNTGAGRGVAWGDIDNDGDADLFLANEGAANKLFRNDGASFADVTPALLSDGGASRSPAFGDYDNDGDLDLYLTKNGANRLFRNEGGNTWSDQSVAPINDADDGQGGSWADFDNDGDLDLYVCNFGTSNRLFRNDGAGAWADVTAGVIGNTGFTRSASWGDYDNDGDVDLYFTNEGPNRLARNNGDGTFTGATNGPLTDNSAGRGNAWSDYDNDGDLDMLIVNRDAANRLARNSAGSFSDAGTGGIAVSDTSNGVAWLDYDNDGDQDAFLTGDGRPNHLVRNENNGEFWSIVANSGFVADGGAGQGVAVADYDLDGDQDLYIANSGTANKLLRNDFPHVFHWLDVKCTGVNANRAGIGARVEVHPTGGSKQIREISGGSNYLSQDEPVAHFGLGTLAGVDSVVVRWSSGLVQAVTGIAIDQRLLVTEGAATAVDEDLGSFGAVLSPSIPNPMGPSTRFRFALASASDATLRVYTADGRLVRTLLEGATRAGAHEVVWDGRDGAGRAVASGVYFYRLSTPGLTQSRSVVVAH